MISIPQQLVIRLEEVDGNESETERDMFISPFVDVNEDSEQEDEDGNIFYVFNEESDDEYI